MSDAIDRVVSSASKHLDRADSTTKQWAEITFQARRHITKPAKFVKVDLRKDDQMGMAKTITNFLVAENESQYPSLLINVTGSAAEDSVQLRRNLFQRFSDGLMGAASGTDAWILTGGTEAGIMKVIGDMQSEWGSPALCIAMAPIGAVKNGRALENDKNTIVFYENDKDGKVINNKDGAYLDPNHTHYILFDTGKNLEEHGAVAWASDSLFVTSMEKCITHSNDEHGEIVVPAILILYGGGVTSMEQVIEAVRNKTPVLIVTKSRRIADVLHACYEEREDEYENLLKTFLEENKVTREEIEPGIKEACAGQLKFYNILDSNENLIQILVDSVKENESLSRNVKLATLANWAHSNTSASTELTDLSLEALHQMLSGEDSLIKENPREQDR
jgi:transient receptor potential cation channel subfamily M protein 2